MEEELEGEEGEEEGGELMVNLSATMRNLSSPSLTQKVMTKI